MERGAVAPACDAGREWGEGGSVHRSVHRGPYKPLPSYRPVVHPMGDECGADAGRRDSNDIAIKPIKSLIGLIKAPIVARLISQENARVPHRFSMGRDNRRTRGWSSRQGPTRRNDVGYETLLVFAFPPHARRWGYCASTLSGRSQSIITGP